MSTQDKDIQQLFQSKLAKHESPVSAEVWAGVQSGLGASGAGAASTAGLLGSGKVLVIASITAIIVAAVSVAVIVGPEEKPVQPKTEQTIEVQQEEPALIEEASVLEDTEAAELKPEEETPPAKTKSNASINPSASSSENPVQKSTGILENTANLEPVESTSSENNVQSVSKTVASESIVEVSEATQANENEVIERYVPFIKQAEDNFMTLEFSIDPGANDVAWDFGDGGRSNQSGGTYSYTQQGNYDVVARWADASGEIQEQRFEVQAFEAPVLVLPNIFTPGTTPGKNDFYDIDQAQSKNIEDYTIKIYSREGELIFESSSEIKTWDGKDRFGNPLPKGSYFALVEARNIVDQRITKQQTIYLKRD